MTETFANCSNEFRPNEWSSCAKMSQSTFHLNPEATPSFTVWLRFLFAGADFTLELTPSELSFYKKREKRRENGEDVAENVQYFERN